jgi:hypothetical protein
MVRDSADRPSRGGSFYHNHREAERERKQLERARLASAAYGFIEIHPEFSQRWHPVYDPHQHTYRLTSRQEADWRRFLREHNWQVGEKGREGRILRHAAKGQRPRPLRRDQEAARERFRSEALGRAPESYRGIYNA